MQKFYYTIEQAAKGELETAIEYSIPLIVTALQLKKFKQENFQIKNKYLDMLIHEQRKKQAIDGYLAWLYGRVVYSNKITNTRNEFDNLKLAGPRNFVMQIEKPQNGFEAWATGYFSFDPSVYSKKSNLFQSHASTIQPEVDKLWAYGMFLSAASMNKDKETYANLKKDLVDSVKVNDVNEALDKIPLDDYRGWAVGLQLVSESHIDRKSPLVPVLLKQLEDIINTQKIENDKVLAESYLFFYNENYS
jgi:hypothetical protein